jgi:hypothetical protein
MDSNKLQLRSQWDALQGWHRTLRAKFFKLGVLPPQLAHQASAKQNVISYKAMKKDNQKTQLINLQRF